jgi:hypothetical protein
MDDKRFWDVIAFACQHDVSGPFEAAWRGPLVEALATLPADDVVAFGHWFDGKVEAANTHDLLAVAYWIGYSASELGFRYFRSWLVGMGKRTYESALADPDSLADVTTPGRDDYEAQLDTAAREAWRLLGRGDLEYNRAHDALGPLRPARAGEEWDFFDADNSCVRFPRLWRRHFDRADEEGD